MPVRIDELCAELDHEIASAGSPEAQQDMSPIVGWSPALLGFAGPSLASMMADSLNASPMAFGDVVGLTLDSIGPRFVAETGVQHALATQVDASFGLRSTAALVAESLGWFGVGQPDRQSSSSPFALTRSLFPVGPFAGTDLALLSDFRSIPAGMGLAGLDALFARPALDDLLPGLSVVDGMSDAVPSALRQLMFPLDEAINQLTSMQTAWQFDTSRLLGTSLFDRLDEIFFPSGTLHSDLFLLMLATANPAQADPALVEEAICAVAEQIPWRVYSPLVWRAICRRADADATSVRAIKQRELRAAILLALETRDVPQAVRLGREWLTADDGRKDRLPPHELPMRWFWQWLCSKAIAMAEASLLEEPFPTTKDVLDRPRQDGQPDQVISLDAGSESTDGRGALALLLVDQSDPLTMLIAQDEHDELVARLHAVLAVASPRQRQLLTLIGDGLSEAEAARQLGLAPATVRVQLHRLRRKSM